MSKLRQLPEIYLRGSLANETMKNLTTSQRAETERLAVQFYNSPGLIGHKQEFCKQLSQTIKSDYKDQNAAEQEFYIAIWRGVVHIMYHTTYEFKCGHCKAKQYQTLRNQPKAMDRRYPICPNCNVVKLVDPERYINHDELQERIGKGKPVPHHTTPIISFPVGPKKVPNHEALLKDEVQVARFFGEFIWNYFRQILKENEIKYHNKRLKYITGPADEIAVEEIVSLFVRRRINHEYNKRGNPQSGFYQIMVETYLLPPDLTCEPSMEAGELTGIVRQYERLGVPIRITEHAVMVKDMCGRAKMAEALVCRPELVCMSSQSGSINEEDGNSSIYDRVSRDEMVKGASMLQDADSVDLIEAEDLFEVIRDSLPTGVTQQVFDIINERGEIYAEFSSSDVGKATNGIAKHNHIARFLGKSPQKINQCIKHIRVTSIAHGLVPVKY